ncbi:glycosyltransferase family 4 protein [Halobaculum sp. CBA1158]|uniref:glycosyltransferase family 4 protein n=1 Tax=Halobaculum sp. CBA1158 TaxID=2904243 RepID=UPI001F34717B|nr:glycosyltransferase family 4 protein [Halobaculum sp. CBA1158]UIP01067.1 glycosyltransferase family 4 protein [Halobaculum sp. CBA1158]
MRVGLYGPLNEEQTGPSRVTSGLASGLQKLGHEPVLVTYGNSQEHPQATVHHIGERPGNVRGYLDVHRRGEAVMSDVDVDVVHCLKGTFESSDVRTVHGTLTFLKVPLGTYSPREMVGDAVMSYYSRKSALASSTVVSTSPEVATMLRRWWRIDSITIPLGIDEEILADDIETERPTVFLPGRISKKKGQLGVLRSLDTSRCDVHLAGSVKDEAYARDVLDFDITYHGYVSREELLNLYSRADVTVVGSTHEFFSVTALEALARSSALVITDSCGIATYPHVRESSAVRVVGDQGAAGQAAIDLVEDPSLPNRKQVARDLASGMTWRSVAGSYVDRYD